MGSTAYRFPAELHSLMVLAVRTLKYKSDFRGLNFKEG